MPDTIQNTVIKNIKQYSLNLTGDNYNQLTIIAERYINAKNYFYHRFSGINSIHLLKQYKKTIRDEIVKQNTFSKQWRLSARYWKNALDDAVSNIKTQWTTVKKNVKYHILKNKTKFTDEEQHMLFYVLKSDSILQQILTKSNIVALPDKFNNISIERKKQLFKLINRLIRKYKGKISKTKKRNFLVDQDMYKYELVNNVNTINITSIDKGKRLSIPVNTNDIFTGTLRICLEKDKITINHAHKLKTKKQKINKENNQENQEKSVIGVDKNYTNVITTSNENMYGNEVNTIFTNKSDKLKAKNKQRQFFWDLMKKINEQLKEKGITQGKKESLNQKILNIKKYNLGYKKYNRLKNKFDSKIKSTVNYSLNQFIETEFPTEIINERLDFYGKKKYGKRNNRLMSSWMKGYTQERIEYKSKEKQIINTEINAAYTSQECGKCGAIGLCEGGVFYCLSCNRAVPAHINSAQVVRNRKYDKAITLNMPPNQVLKILMERTKTVVGNQGSKYYITHGDWLNPDYADWIKKIKSVKSELLKNVSKPILE